MSANAPTGVELEDEWRSFLAVPFPDARGRDAVVDLAAYDAFVAGVVSQVVSGGRIPVESRDDLQPDAALRARVAELADPVVADYLDRLERLIATAKHVDAVRER